jgi:hypothetical protein
MQPEMMQGTRAQIVGKFTLYIRPDGSLVAATGNHMTRMIVTPDEARGLFDYLLQYARYFEQASNGHAGSTEPLRLGQAQA